MCSPSTHIYFTFGLPNDRQIEGFHSATICITEEQAAETVQTKLLYHFVGGGEDVLGKEFYGKPSKQLRKVFGRGTK